MKPIIYVLACMSIALVAGCTTTTTKFVDADGTVYQATTITAPFGKTDSTAHQFTYTWGDAATGAISVGQDASGMDNSAQVEGIPAAITATGTAISAALQATASTAASTAIKAATGAPGAK